MYLGVYLRSTFLLCAERNDDHDAHRKYNSNKVDWYPLWDYSFIFSKGYSNYQRHR